ncbi:F-box protein At2g32560-like [Malania oleifera]|uniref:F-box protein At2g32560-like n=1 Tax=Malania oleifera TaxID=397392 RepID=UPI0025ADD45F|nr:F-box protein At2g32560-like [Malania oleifera]
MLFFLISCFSFILLSKSFSHKPPPSWRAEMRLLAHELWEEFPSFLVSWFQKSRLGIKSFRVPTITQLKKMSPSSQAENVEPAEERISLLDLPELTLECIFEQLSPAGLCSMAGACTSLRDRCRSDHLWKKHMKRKWGRLIGDVAYREWQWYIASRERTSLLDQSKHRGLFASLLKLWPLSWFRCNLDACTEPKSCLPVDSIMAWYLSLESGKFWFPAQVYNRESGHVGFLLSCYDADLSYDFCTDTFRARYSLHGRQTIEENIQWDRLRAPPVNTPAHVLHVSDCLNDLKPGDHVEIQWRRNREFPYGWWYGVVGHLKSCDENENNCRCHTSGMVILEFNQYSPDSRWRQTVINRKDHREEGNDVDGFYGGIRKLYKEEEISTWKRLRPTQVLE